MYNVYIYGTGYNTEKLYEFIDMNRINILGFIETNPIKTSFKGKEVVSYNEIYNLAFDYIIIGSTKYENEIRNSLIKAGIGEEEIISGKLEFENIGKLGIFLDLNKVQVVQNERIKVDLNYIKWRNIFWDYAKGVKWFDKETPMVVGGWSVCYDYLFILISILDIIKPKTILEMGLGETSKIIMQYAEWCKSQYDVCEQDEEWIKFFEQKYRLSNDMTINILPIEKKYNEKYDINVATYKNFAQSINKKYNFISIDGPIGTPGFSRIDILECLPDCLDDKFCILLDDYHRIGEYRMIEEMKQILFENNINFFEKKFGEKRQFCLVCSEEYRWLETYLPESF